MLSNLSDTSLSFDNDVVSLFNTFGMEISNVALAIFVVVSVVLNLLSVSFYKNIRNCNSFISG